MAMTTAQLATFKAAIDAETDGELVGYRVSGADNSIAEWYSANASPDYWILRDDVPSEEVANAINLQNMADITTADSGRAVQFFQIRAVNGGGFHGSNASDRTAWDDVFSSAAGDESQQAIAALWQRTATNVERVFAAGAGGAGTSDGSSSANADITTFQGSVSSADVAASNYTHGV